MLVRSRHGANTRAARRKVRNISLPRNVAAGASNESHSKSMTALSSKAHAQAFFGFVNAGNRRDLDAAHLRLASTFTTLNDVHGFALDLD